MVFLPNKNLKWKNKEIKRFASVLYLEGCFALPHTVIIRFDIFFVILYEKRISHELTGLFWMFI